jgi:hypothetical protein
MRPFLPRLKALALCLVSVTVHAQDFGDFVPDESGAGTSEDRVWTLTGGINASGNVGSNRRVIGQIEGTGITLGSALTGSATYQGGPHEFRATFLSQQNFSRTPLLDAFIKSGDTLALEAIYFYHLPTAPWFGPFARARVDTALFPGFDFRAEEAIYRIAFQDGVDRDITTRRLRLTDGLQPAQIRQSLGAFAKPIQESWLRADIRLGAGARQGLANGQLVLQDNADTADVIEVTELASFTQAGAELALVLAGQDNTGDVTWSLSFDTMAPLLDSTSEDSGRSVLQSTNYEVAGLLSFKLTSWASLDYQLRATRIPALLEEWQVANLLLVTMGGNWTREIRR